jgi:hypothetical protein
VISRSGALACYAKGMTHEVVHGFEHETDEAKLEWFRSLSIVERLEVLDSYYRLAVALNPKLREGTDARPDAATVRVLELPPG